MNVLSKKIEKMNDTEQRMLALEEKCAWLEDQLENQGRELTQALDELNALKRSLKILISKTADPYATRDLKDEVPPPHY